MRSKPVSADCIFEDQEHPDHSAGGKQSSHNRGDDQNVVERAKRGSGGRRRSLDRRSGTCLSYGRGSGSGPWRRRSGCRRGFCRGKWCCTGSAGRTAGRQRRQFDGRRRGWFRRQIDSDGLFFGLDLAGFFFYRRHSACGRAWYVRRNVSHSI